MSGVRKAILVVAVAAVSWFFVLPFLDRVIWNRGVLQWDAKSNYALTFYGKVVDQDGRPLCGAVVMLTLNVFNSQWAPIHSAGRGRMRQEMLKATTNNDGTFLATLRAFDVVTSEIRFSGHRWIESDKKGERGEGSSLAWQYNERIGLGVLGGRQTYKSDSDNPTIYVMLRDGAPPVVHAKMSRGGAEANSTGSSWIRNEPFWPARTKPAGITYEVPTTEPGH